MGDRDFRKELDTSDIRADWAYELLDEVDRLREELARLKAANGVDDDGNLIHKSINTGE